MTTSLPAPGAALVIIDAQQGFRDLAFWGEPGSAPVHKNIAAVIAEWERRGDPVIVVQHRSDNPLSPLFPAHPGYELEGYVPRSPTLHITKSVNSSFHGTPDLEEWLRGARVREIVIAGITTNHCCETTARVGANLGFGVWFVLDATATFARTGPDGSEYSADHLAVITATNLHGEFATVLSTAELVAG